MICVPAEGAAVGRRRRPRRPHAAAEWPRSSTSSRSTRRSSPDKYSSTHGHRRPRGGLARDRRGPRQLCPTQPSRRTARSTLVERQRRRRVAGSRAAPTAPACSPSTANASAGMRPQVGLRTAARRTTAGSASRYRSAPSASPPPSTNICGIEHVGEVDQPERDPAAELVDHARARRGRPRRAACMHVLAADVRRRRRRPVRRTRRSRPPTAASRASWPARTPTRSAPSSRAGRTGTAARRGRRPCARSRRRTRWRRGCSSPAGDDPAADAGAERDHHHVGRPLRRRRTATRRAAAHVASLPTSTPSPEPLRQHAGDVEVGDVDQVRRRPQHAVARDQARHADAERVVRHRARRPARRASSISFEQAVRAARCRPAFLGDDSPGASSTTPRHLVPPTSMPTRAGRQSTSCFGVGPSARGPC